MNQDLNQLTKSQWRRISDALDLLDQVNDELSEELTFPNALEQVMFYAGWAVKEVEGMKPSGV